MPELERSIVQWRAHLAQGRRLDPETLDELEAHLRESALQLICDGLSEAEAFQRASAQLGSAENLAAEFGKLGSMSWLPARIAVWIGVAITIVMAPRIYNNISAGSPSGSTRALSAAYAITGTLGFYSTALLNFLAICFVCQRCVANFSPSRLASMQRPARRFAAVAAVSSGLNYFLCRIWQVMTSPLGWPPHPRSLMSRSVWAVVTETKGKGQYTHLVKESILLTMLCLAVLLIGRRFRLLTPRNLLRGCFFGSNILIAAMLFDWLKPQGLLLADVGGMGMVALLWFLLRSNTEALLISSLFGSNILLLAGGALSFPSTQHFAPWLLAINLVLCLIGLAPPAWLRLPRVA